MTRCVDVHISTGTTGKFRADRHASFFLSFFLSNPPFGCTRNRNLADDSLQPADSIFSSENTVCPHIINSSRPRPITYRDLDQTKKEIRQMTVWKRLLCPQAVQRRGLKGGYDDDRAGTNEDKDRLRFYAAVPLVIRWPGEASDSDVNDWDDTPLGAEQSALLTSSRCSSPTSTTPPGSTRTTSPSPSPTASPKSPRRTYKPSSSKDRHLPQDLITLGTLCILDTEPRPNFSAEEEETLRQLGDLLVRLICTEQSEGWAMREVGGYKGQSGSAIHVSVPALAITLTRTNGPTRRTQSSSTFCIARPCQTR